MIVEIVVMFLAVIGFIVAMALHTHLSAPWNYVGWGLLGVCAFACMVLFISITYASLTTALAVLYHDQRLRNDSPLPAPQQALGPA